LDVKSKAKGHGKKKRRRSSKRASADNQAEAMRANYYASVSNSRTLTHVATFRVATSADHQVLEGEAVEGARVVVVATNRSGSLVDHMVAQRVHNECTAGG
jgi:hypothetical protein